MARWALIAGPKRSDKTAVALELVAALRKRGIAVGGIVQVRRGDFESGHVYDLERLSTGEKVHLALDPSLASDEHEAFCSLSFKMDAFVTARRWLEEDSRTSRVLFLGDVSKLEVADGGHADTLRWALALPDTHVVVLSVRSDQLFYVVEAFDVETDPLASLELPADEGRRLAFVAEATAGIARDETRSKADA